MLASPLPKDLPKSELIKSNKARSLETILDLFLGSRNPVLEPLSIASQEIYYQEHGTETDLRLEPDTPMSDVSPSGVWIKCSPYKIVKILPI